MEERKEALQHRIVWTDRKRGNITGVTDVGSFDETTVILETDQGILTLKGKGLHIGKLSLEQGEVGLDGVIESMVYTGSRPAKKGSVLKRLFR